MLAFQIGFLREDFAALGKFFGREHEIVPASHFSVQRPTAQFHRKVVIGRLLSITTPDQTSYAGKLPVFNAAKKPRLGAHPSAVMLTFGDCFNRPQCFVIFVERKTAFQHLFGSNLNKCESIRVGDILAVKDPEMSDETLGSSMHILREPQLLVALKTDNWPQQPICRSTEANYQVYFSEEGKLIDVFGAIMISHGRVLKCQGYTCDRQTNCKGCFGKACTLKPIVLQCTVDVRDTPEYENANFPKFTSLQFTGLFFRDLPGLSARHLSVMTSMYDCTADAIDKMVDVVNRNGGWTVSGWHRQGVRNEGTTIDELYNGRTRGHITYLQPSDRTSLDLQEYLDLMLETPTDDSLPHLDPPALGATPSPQTLLQGTPLRTATNTTDQSTAESQGNGNLLGSPPGARRPATVTPARPRLDIQDLLLGATIDPTAQNDTHFDDVSAIHGQNDGADSFLAPPTDGEALLNMLD